MCSKRQIVQPDVVDGGNTHQFIRETILRRLTSTECEEDEPPIPEFQRVTISGDGTLEVSITLVR
jgi:hypothetical protein